MEDEIKNELTEIAKQCTLLLTMKCYNMPLMKRFSLLFDMLSKEEQKQAFDRYSKLIGMHKTFPPISPDPVGILYELWYNRSQIKIIMHFYAPTTQRYWRPEIMIIEYKDVLYSLALLDGRRVGEFRSKGDRVHRFSIDAYINSIHMGCLDSSQEDSCESAMKVRNIIHFLFTNKTTS